RRIFCHVSDRLFALGRGAAARSGDENVEVAHGFASAAQRSGGGDLLKAWELAEILCELRRFRFGGVDQESAADAAVVLDGLEQLLLVLFAHAREFTNLSLAGQFFDAIDIADLVGAPDQGNCLWPQ